MLQGMSIYLWAALIAIHSLQTKPKQAFATFGMFADETSNFRGIMKGPQVNSEGSCADWEAWAGVEF